MGYSKIVLRGQQTCDYLYIQTDAPALDEFAFVNDEPAEWRDTTSLYANFSDENRRLNAGDSEIVGTISGYEVYRRKYNEAHSEYVCTIQKNGYELGENLSKCKQALEEEYQKIIDWNLEEYLPQIKNGSVQSVFGNIDMNDRIVITWSEKLKKIYQNALTSWDYNPENGSVDTVFGTSRRFGSELDGVGWEIAFSPIMPDGTFLSEDVVSEYFNALLAEAYEDDGKVVEEELKSIDKNGKTIGGIHVYGIFAAIDHSTNYTNNGNWAEVVGKLMHFSGAYGAVQMLEKEIKEIEQAITKMNNVGDLIVDYTVKNGVDYTYYLYPNTETSKGGSPLSPFITKQVSIDTPYWCLFVVDETEEENVFYLNKMFKFELNLQVEDMNNNAQITISQNFTKYPTIQYGASNYWSGSLSALSGFLSANCIDYIQNANMLAELKSISTDTRRKFLKDIEGNLWEVNVSAPISVSTDNLSSQTLRTWKFSWVEVGDATGVSIINDPNKAVTDWVLTENGEAIPYFTYQWDEQYRWDNSYFWTSNDDIFGIKNTNLGREIME